MRKSIIATGILALASPLAVFGTAGHASATSCTSDAVVVETAYFHASDGSRVGSLEIYYSSACQEVWARGESNWPYGGIIAIEDPGTDGYQYCFIPSSADAYCDTSTLGIDSQNGDYAYGYVWDSSGNQHPGQTATYK
jgi:hypothetical protein